MSVGHQTWMPSKTTQNLRGAFHHYCNGTDFKEILLLKGHNANVSDGAKNWVWSRHGSNHVSVYILLTHESCWSHLQSTMLLKFKPRDIMGQETPCRPVDVCLFGERSPHFRFLTHSHTSKRSSGPVYYGRKCSSVWTTRFSGSTWPDRTPIPLIPPELLWNWNLWKHVAFE